MLCRKFRGDRQTRGRGLVGDPKKRRSGQQSGPGHVVDRPVRFSGDDPHSTPLPVTSRPSNKRPLPGNPGALYRSGTDTLTRGLTFSTPPSRTPERKWPEVCTDLGRPAAREPVAEVRISTPATIVPPACLKKASLTLEALARVRQAGRHGAFYEIAQLSLFGTALR